MTKGIHSDGGGGSLPLPPSTCLPLAGTGVRLVRNERFVVGGVLCEHAWRACDGGGGGGGN